MGAPPIAPGPPEIPPLATVPVILLHEDIGCHTQGANMGTAYTFPSECAAAAMQDPRCHSLGTIMWSHTYNSAWGCRCCTTSLPFATNNANWDVYQAVMPPATPPKRM